MCCFSGPVASISATRIFARIEGRRQFLVYQMTFSAQTDLAMVLPIPVALGLAEDAVDFINLEHYASFFADLERLYPKPRGRGASRARLGANLVVHDVGIYEASFVPTIADFSRLDPRFRLPDTIWDDLPAYAQYGFAVFKLKGGEVQKVHPLAFSFPTRTPDALFFPTLHVHDGQVHSRARFDHILYCQTTKRVPESSVFSHRSAWVRSSSNAGRSFSIDQAQGIVDGDQPCLKKVLVGQFANQDQRL